MEQNPVKIPTKAMTLWRLHDLVASEAGSSTEPTADPSPGWQSHVMETKSGHEELGQCPAAEKAGVERSWGEEEEAKKTLGETGSNTRSASVRRIYFVDERKDPTNGAPRRSMKRANAPVGVVARGVTA